MFIVKLSSLNFFTSHINEVGLFSSTVWRSVPIEPRKKERATLAALNESSQVAEGITALQTRNTVHIQTGEPNSSFMVMTRWQSRGGTTGFGFIPLTDDQTLNIAPSKNPQTSMAQLAIYQAGSSIDYDID